MLALVALLLPLFPPSVQQWRHEVALWAWRYDLDPALVMTVMQLESCGDPGVTSGAGAAGLFQVMPFHFAPGEDRYAPHVNAHRGLTYLRLCLDLADGDASRALACYNGGGTLLSRPLSAWPRETQVYVYWGSRLYDRAVRGAAADPIYDAWWHGRARYVCERALISPD